MASSQVDRSSILLPMSGELPHSASCGYCGKAATKLWGRRPPTICISCLEVSRQILDQWSAPENKARTDAYGKEYRERLAQEGNAVPSCSFCGTYADDLLSRDLHVVANGNGLFICDPCVRTGLAAIDARSSSSPHGI